MKLRDWLDLPKQYKILSDRYDKLLVENERLKKKLAERINKNETKD